MPSAHPACGGGGRGGGGGSCVCSCHLAGGGGGKGGSCPVGMDGLHILVIGGPVSMTFGDGLVGKAGVQVGGALGMAGFLGMARFLRCGGGVAGGRGSAAMARLKRVVAI